MEYLIVLILGALGFGFYQFKKRNEAEVEVKLAETKGKDIVLQTEQVKIQNEIKEIDNRLEEIKENRKEQLKKQDELTLAERAKAAKDRFGK